MNKKYYMKTEFVLNEHPNLFLSYYNTSVLKQRTRGIQSLALSVGLCLSYFTISRSMWYFIKYIM